MAQKLVKQGFNSLAGVKLRTIDPAWQISDARRLYGERLGDFMEDYTESYVPKDRLPYLPADKILDYQIFRTLGRDLREARKK
jgi:acetyl esterase/lipase